MSGVVVDGPVVTDSREAGPGGLYVARVGEQRRRPRLRAARRVDARRGGRADHPAGGGPALRRRPRRAGRVRRARPGRASTAARTSPSSAVTGSSGKTSTKDLLASGARAARADGRRHRLAQLRGRRAAHGAAAITADHPLPGRRDGRPRRRAHRLPHPHRPARRSASCSTSAPPTWASSARGRRSREAKSELVAGPARRRCRGPQRRRPGGGRHAQPHRRPRRGRRARPRPPTCAPTDIRLDEAGRPSFDPAPAAGGEAPVRLGLHGEHHVGNALAVAAVALHGRHDRGRRSPRRWARPGPPAAGGWRSTSAPTA